MALMPLCQLSLGGEDLDQDPTSDVASAEEEEEVEDLLWSERIKHLFRLERLHW